MQLADITHITPGGLRAAYLNERNRMALEWLRISLDRLLIIEAEGPDSVIIGYMTVPE
jgi:hypothetical protein